MTLQPLPAEAPDWMVCECGYLMVEDETAARRQRLRCRCCGQTRPYPAGVLARLSGMPRIPGLGD